jgi:hypothetical protein
MGPAAQVLELFKRLAIRMINPWLFCPLVTLHLLVTEPSIRELGSNSHSSSLIIARCVPPSAGPSRKTTAATDHCCTPCSCVIWP